MLRRRAFTKITPLAVLLLFSTLTVLYSSVNSAINWNSNSFAQFCNWTGNDLNQSQVASDQCEFLCRRTANCTHWTWTFKNGSTCYLKALATYRTDAVETADPFTICGLVYDGVDWGNNQNQALRCDWNSPYLSKITAVKDQCFPICQRTSSCTMYSWSGGICWMFSGLIDKTRVVHTTDTDAICGYIGSGKYFFVIFDTRNN
jgi:hypothetical protein